MKVLRASLGSILICLLTLSAGQTLAISELARQQGIPTLAPMLEEVTPAVVSIRVAKSVPTTGQFGGRNIPDELRRLIPDLNERNRAPRAMGAGSGVIIDASSGYVVTNHHVVADAVDISVQLSDGRSFEGELLGSDPGTDIALLQIAAEDLADIGLANIGTVDVGDYVVAIGNPFGIGQTVTSGIVSALGRAGLNNENYEDFIQTDAAINMGNSGGALVDLEGNLVGINTAIISGSGGSNGIGFAVPVDMMSAVVEILEEDGEVRRGMLGVSIADVTPEVANALELAAVDGALVTGVLEGSAAEEAGIETSDVIIELNGERIASSRDLRNRVGLLRRGEQVSLRLYRNGDLLDIDAVIGGPTGVALNESGRPALNSNFRGARLRSLDTSEVEFTDSGVLVLEVEDRSPSAAAGLRAGDVIVAVNRRSVNNLSEFSTAIEDTERLTAITVLREGRSLLLFIP